MTRNCEGTNKLSNAKKTAMFYLQNCDLLKFFRIYQNFDFFSRKTQKLCMVRKNFTNKKVWNYLLHLCTMTSLR